MQSYMKGRQVYCVITDKYGNTLTTDVATISLPAVELKILDQPKDVYAVKGEKFSIKPIVQGDGRIGAKPIDLQEQFFYGNGTFVQRPMLVCGAISAYAFLSMAQGNSLLCWYWYGGL